MTNANIFLIFSIFVHNHLQITFMPLSQNLKTDLSLFFITVIWALNFTVVKASLSEIDPYSFNAIRFLLAALFIWVIIFFQNETFRIRKKDWLPLIGMGVAGNLLYQVLFIFGINLSLAANAAILLGTIPIWVAVTSHFFSIEFMNRLTAIGVVLGFAGLILIIMSGVEPIKFGSDSFRGDVFFNHCRFGLGTLYYFFKTVSVALFAPSLLRNHDFYGCFFSHIVGTTTF